MAAVRAPSLAELRAELEAAGCFERAPGRAILALAGNLAGAAALLVASARAPLALAIPAFIGGSFLFYRLGWLMHDAAHGGVFEGGPSNRRFAALVAGILGELPSGWRYGHGRHHAAPNVRGRDLDQAERWDPERRYQTRLGAAVGLLLFSRVKRVYLPKTLLLLGLRDGYFCYRHHRRDFPRELACSLASFTVQVALFSALHGAAGPLLFLLHTHLGLVYLNSAFAGNHYDLEHFDEEAARELDFAELQVRTTRNYEGGAVTRFVFGGLEHQIEHHLFPAMPRHHFTRAAPIVRAFCEARGLPYRSLPFLACMKRVIDFHLKPAPPPAAGASPGSAA